MNNPKISIIVPVYNVQKYLIQCLDSLKNQSYSDIEIICINDGSTDNSIHILKKYGENDSRFRVYEQNNLGVSSARNKGIEVASGEYIMFVDSDDWIDHKTCETTLNIMISKQTDVVLFNYIRVKEAKLKEKYVFDKDVYFDGTTIQEIHRRMIGLSNKELRNLENADALVPACMKLYRKKIIRENNIKFMDLRIIGTSEDAVFNLEYFEKCNSAYYLNKPLYFYRRDNSYSITTIYKPDLYVKWDRLFDYFEKYIISNELSSDYTEALKNRIALSIIGLGLNELCSKSSHREILSKIKTIISSTRYQNAYRSLELKYFSIHWKVFFIAAKLEFEFLLYILLKYIETVK
jgi:glycosyltransferase involved in cell wall biosynthesis